MIARFNFRGWVLPIALLSRRVDVWERESHIGSRCVDLVVVVACCNLIMAIVTVVVFCFRQRPALAFFRDADAVLFSQGLLYPSLVCDWRHFYYRFWCYLYDSSSVLLVLRGHTLFSRAPWPSLWQLYRAGTLGRSRKTPFSCRNGSFDPNSAWMVSPPPPAPRPYQGNAKLRQGHKEKPCL